MTRLERRRIIRNTVLGSLLTLLVIAADLGGSLRALERWFYDRRARVCQLFMRPPTDRLVHLDIDDDSLDEIGGWPWERATLAAIIDEVNAAGARVIGVDVIVQDPKPDDAALARAIVRRGNVVLPMSFKIEPEATESTAYLKAHGALLGDLELSPEAVAARLRDAGISVGAEFNDVFMLASREATRVRIEGELDGRDGPVDVDELVAALTPVAHAQWARTQAVREVERQAPVVEASLALRRFARPGGDGLPPLIAGFEVQPPSPVLAAAAARSGFANFLPFDDGVVRSVPLFIEHRHTLYPQFGLAVACAALGVRADEIVIAPDHIEVPDPQAGGGAVRIVPVRTIVRDDDGGGVSGMFFDIPWIGTSDWKTMYDFPRHAAVAQHVPVTHVWAARSMSEYVERNNRATDEVLQILLDRMGISRKTWAAYDGRRPDPRIPGSRVPIASQVVWLLNTDKTTARWLQLARSGVPDEKIAPPELPYVQAVRDLLQLSEGNRRLAADLGAQRRYLRRSFAGKTVLIGWAGTGMTDSRPSSLHAECPGVVMHGAIVSAILTGELWRHAPRWLTALVTAGIGLLATAAVALLSPWRATLAAAGLVVAYALVNGLVLFDYGDYLLGVAGPVTAAASVWGACTLTRYVTELTERARITRRFRSYVDPALVEYVLEHPERERLAGERREMTVCFSDLKDFTPLTERLREGVVPVLNRYMEMMVPLIRRRGGYVSKFLGDGIMFFYGAPVETRDHAARAVNTALEMSRMMAEFNDFMRGRGLEPTKTRIGISTAALVVGDAGSLAGPDAARASDYTVVGDAVNLAARLESANKQTGTTILATARTMEQARETFLFRPVGRFRVVGRTECEMTYEPLAPLADATPAQRELAERTRAVVDAFTAGDFARCLAAIDELERLCPCEHDLCALYRTECARYATIPPPAGFCGEIVLESK
jgi:class 3 adenylate cyclase